jgi:hypothetical protein
MDATQTSSTRVLPTEMNAEFKIWNTEDKGVLVNGVTELVKGRLDSTDKLFTAGKVIVGEIDASNSFKSPPTPVDITPPNGDTTLRYPINTYTNGVAQIGKNYAINFELTYVPFYKEALWTGTWSSKKTKWIIRNGVNSKPQNEMTNFNDPNDWFSSYSPTNGNGAVRFTPADTSKEGNFGDTNLGAALSDKASVYYYIGENPPPNYGAYAAQRRGVYGDDLQVYHRYPE